MAAILGGRTINILSKSSAFAKGKNCLFLCPIFSFSSELERKYGA